MGKQNQHLRCRTKLAPYLFCLFGKCLQTIFSKWHRKIKHDTRTVSPQKRKRKQVTQKVMYAEEWEEIFPVGEVNDNLHAFYCIPCKKSVSCAHQGIIDLKDHCEG